MRLGLEQGCLGGGAKCNQRQKMEGLCNRFRAHGLNPLGSMSLETHKKLVSAYWMCTPTRSRRMGGWADGRMGGLAKISGGLCTCFRAHGLDPLGSMSWETHKKSFLAYWMCTPTRSRRMGGWTDGWTCKNFRRDFAIVSGRVVRTLWAACLWRRIRN